jgi:hypothetical protein
LPCLYCCNATTFTLRTKTTMTKSPFSAICVLTLAQCSVLSSDSHRAAFVWDLEHLLKPQGTPFPLRTRLRSHLLRKTSVKIFQSLFRTVLKVTWIFIYLSASREQQWRVGCAMLHSLHPLSGIKWKDRIEQNE